MGEDLVAAVAARGDDRGGGEAPGQLGDRARVRLRREAPVDLRDMDGRDAVLAQRRRRVRGPGADHHGLERLAAGVAARERERLERELVELAVRMLHVREHHHATPSFWNSSTTAGAAAGPSPSTSAWRPRPGGTVSRTISSRGSLCAGSLASTGLRRARSFAGTEG